METYIVRQPIMSDKQKVVAYELLYKENGINATPDRKEAWVASAVEELLGKANDENFLDDKSAFVTFTPNLLMKNIPRMFPEKSLVIQIGDDSIIHPVAQKMLHRFKKQGYRIALKDFEFLPRFFGIMDIVDILKVDFRKPEASLRNIVSVAHNFNKQVAAYHLDTQESLDLARELQCQFYQGTFVAKREKSLIHRIDHMQSNFCNGYQRTLQTRKAYCLYQISKRSKRSDASKLCCNCCNVETPLRLQQIQNYNC